ncbi:MAG: hypothetical protein NZT92_22575, partial [Abditibacteriales bacterium]|nr:hypothetical protein [Abditibacteriales bacterium]MDW8368448.1 methyltransferase [Abditibacteriales bacterium]
FAGLVVGWLFVLCGLFLLGGVMVARAMPYGGLLAQSGFVLWIGVWWYSGFWRLRAVYRERYGRGAYRQLCLRFFLPGLTGGIAALIFPVFMSGPRLLPPVVAYSLAAYLLVTMELLGQRGKELFYNLDLRMFVYSVFPEEGRVITSGVFAWLRHPIYSAFLRWVFALGLLRNNAQALLCAGVIATGLWFWARVEERELAARDAGYEDYRRRVPAFFVTPPARLWRFWRFLVTGKDVNGFR